MNFAVIQDWWGLILIFVAAIVTFIRYTIRIHEAVEGLQKVAEHDKKLTQITDQYNHIQADTTELKGSVEELSASLRAHITEQKDDIRAMTSALYSILDRLKEMGDNKEVAAANLALREHTLKK